MRSRYRVLGFAGALVIILLASAPAVAAPEPICGAVNTDGSTNRGTLALELVNGRPPPPDGPAISFKSKRDERQLLLEFAVTGCSMPETSIGKEVKIESVRGADADGVTLDAKLMTPSRVKAGGVLVVTFAIDPSDTTASPGTYSSGLVVVDPAFNLHRQPVRINLQYGHTIVLLLVCLLPVYFVGTFLVYYKGRAAGSTQKYPGWLIKPGNLLASFVGLIAAFFYIQNTTLADAAFGRDLYDNSIVLWLFQTEFLKALLGAGSAFTTAALGSSLLGDKIRGGTAPQAGAPAGTFAAN